MTPTSSVGAHEVREMLRDADMDVNGPDDMDVGKLRILTVRYTIEWPKRHRS